MRNFAVIRIFVYENDGNSWGLRFWRCFRKSVQYIAGEYKSEHPHYSIIEFYSLELECAVKVPTHEP